MADERATIYDVAKRAGVSVATVSRYINHSGVVSEKAQLRITDAVQELRYIPNTFAKSLKTSCSNLIMMIVPDISNEYYAEMYKVIQRAVGEHGYSILLINTNGQPAEEQRALQLAQQQHCDALAFFSLYDTSAMRQQVQALGIPFLYNSSAHTSQEFEPSIHLTASHLIGLGHRDIVYVGGAPLTYINIMRKNGFLREHGLPCGPDRCIELDFSMEAGVRAGRLIAQRPQRPTAICAANDQLAFGIILALEEYGLQVPGDISLTGMDDVPIAKPITPKLTTIRNDYTGRGAHLAACLLAQLGIGSLPGEYVPPAPQVIVRGSTRAL